MTRLCLMWRIEKSEKLDTGAKANLISVSDIKEMKEKPKIQRVKPALKDYNGQKIE